MKKLLQMNQTGRYCVLLALIVVLLVGVGLTLRTENDETVNTENNELTQETYGWAVEDNSILYHDAAVYEITDAYSYGEITGNFVSQDTAYVAYHLEDARICVLSTHDAGESWQQTCIGEAWEMDGLGALYLSFLENGTGYLLYTSSPAAGLMFKVLYTSVDGGSVFELVGDITDSVDNYPQWMVFYDENMGMILTQYHGYEAYAYQTTDGGTTWSALDLNVPSAEGSSYVDGISLIQTEKETDTWAMRLQAVWDDRQDIYLRSTDGWATWSEQ